jgi:hypothetical protein
MNSKQRYIPNEWRLRFFEHKMAPSQNFRMGGWFCGKYIIIERRVAQNIMTDFPFSARPVKSIIGTMTYFILVTLSPHNGFPFNRLFRLYMFVHQPTNMNEKITIKKPST